MFTQSLEYAAIRFLEGYWGCGAVAEDRRYPYRLGSRASASGRTRTEMIGHQVLRLSPASRSARNQCRLGHRARLFKRSMSSGNGGVQNPLFSATPPRCSSGRHGPHRGHPPRP
jgi:hypothetical protein